eukprot:4627066-Amphidinium_carterae.1
MLAFTRARAEEGDPEAQVVCEKMELTQDSAELRRDDDNKQDTPGSAGDNLNGLEDFSMRDGSEEQQGVAGM